MIYLPDHVTLVAVSKGRSVEQIAKVYEMGIRDFGENRVDEALLKMEALPKDIRWHFIGRLQRKKVPKVLGRFHLIHSVDSEKLAYALAKGNESILLQVNTSGEKSKAGLTSDEWKKHIPNLIKCKGLNVCGLMTMAPLSDDQEMIRKTFARLRYFKEELNNPKISTLSMGMSSDYKIAVEEGSTMVRLGSLIF